MEKEETEEWKWRGKRNEKYEMMINDKWLSAGRKREKQSMETYLTMRIKRVSSVR